MSDGSWGYTAEQGLKAVLGGVDVDKMNRREGAMTPAQMRAYIKAAPKEKNVSYSDEARRFAKVVLERADKDPEEFLRLSDKGYDFFKDTDKDCDLTGFMYGWAVNAVRYVLSSQPVPNPAVVTLPYDITVRG